MSKVSDLIARFEHVSKQSEETVPPLARKKVLHGEFKENKYIEGNIENRFETANATQTDRSPPQEPYYFPYQDTFSVVPAMRYPLASEIRRTPSQRTFQQKKSATSPIRTRKRLIPVESQFRYEPSQINIFHETIPTAQPVPFFDARAEQTEGEEQNNLEETESRSSPAPNFEGTTQNRAEVDEFLLITSYSKRKCRDIVCLMGFIVMIIGMCIIGIISFKLGNTNALIHATDYLGRICGECGLDSNDTCSKPYQVINPDISVAIFSVCRESCPKAGDIICTNGTVANKENNICWTSFTNQESLFFTCIPLTMQITTCMESPYLVYLNQSVPISANDPLCGKCLDPEFETDGLTPMDPSSSLCKAKVVKSETSTQYQKLPSIFDEIFTWSEIFVHYLSDLQNSWSYILFGGGFGSLVCSIVWIGLFACLSKFLIWGTILIIILGFTFVSFELLYAGGVVNKNQIASGLQNVKFISQPEALASIQIFQGNSAAQMQVYAILGWILVSVTMLILLISFCIRKSINRICNIMKSAARVILRHPKLFSLSVFNFLIILVISTWCTFVLILLVSIGRISGNKFVIALTGNNITSLTPSLRQADFTPILLAFHLVSCIWLIFFVRAVFAISTAYFVANWKFKQNVTIADSIYIVTRFHLGSAVLGSGVIAIFQVVRTIVIYIERSMKFSNKLKYLQSCLSYFSSLLKFGNKISYIVIALHGESFCSATKSTFILLTSQLKDSTVAFFFSSILVYFGRFFVIGFSVVITWVSVTFKIFSPLNISSALAPCIASAILAWFISGACFDLFSTCLDTLLICKIERKTTERRLELSQV